jgi:hypothetical protein
MSLAKSSLSLDLKSLKNDNSPQVFSSFFKCSFVKTASDIMATVQLFLITS